MAAFEWPGLNGEAVQPESVEHIATLYLEELRRAQPRGPYRLLGWCGGSAIAWEMAQRLMAAQEHVSLFLLDPVVDVFARENLLQELQLFRRCEELFDALKRPSSAEEAETCRQEILQILGGVIDDGPRVSAEDLSDEWHHRVGVWRQLLQTMIDYHFRPYAGRLHLILGDDVAEGTHEVIHGMTYDEYSHRWATLTQSGVRIRRVPGGHFSVLKPPHVEELASLLAEHQE